MKTYTWLLFDLDHTLFDTDTAEALALTKVFSTVTESVSDEMYSVYKIINKKLWKMLETGDIKAEVIKETRFREWLEYFDLQGDSKSLANMYLDALGQGIQLFDGAQKLLQDLSKNYKLAAITNGLTQVQKPRVKASGLSIYFDRIFISEEMGFAKPHKEFFNLVLDEIKAKPEECLILGDSMSSDILGGINANIDTCLVNLLNRKEAPYQPNYSVASYEELLLLLQGI